MGETKVGETIQGTKVSIGLLEDLPLKVGKEVIVKDYTIAVFRLSNGKVKAVENKCPHQEGPLSQGIISGDYVFCPLHDWKICLDDGMVQAPDTGCVKTFQVQIEDQEVYVIVP